MDPRRGKPAQSHKSNCRPVNAQATLEEQMCGVKETHILILPKGWSIRQGNRL
jgi:hypothetical protein